MSWRWVGVLLVLGYWTLKKRKKHKPIPVAENLKPFCFHTRVRGKELHVMYRKHSSSSDLIVFIHGLGGQVL